MPVSGHQAELLALGDKQNTVQVVADVVHRHGKRNLLQQGFQRFLRNTEHGAKAGGLLHQREIFGGQGLQRETTFATFEQQLVLARLQTHGLIRRHRTQNINEFARTDGGA